MPRFTSAVVFLLLLASAYVQAEDPIEFDRDIRPILSDKCYYCHGPDHEHREADLRLDLREQTEAVLTPGDSEHSEIIIRILSEDDGRMPPVESKKSLTTEEIKKLTQWVQQGAKWSEHWSFTPPRKNELSADLARDVIDDFVRRQTPENQLAEQAAKETLIRRVTFDLTGLPPTLEEIDEFLKDNSADAFEQVVDRLLQSPRYGQRMTLAWLDAARYGDTSVYHADGPRNMWAWRDAIVDAYNQNMPFSDFSIAQLAGDLVPDATEQQRILAGFNRNNGTTDEGGAIAEEYRVEYVVDRVKTTSSVWLGLTMECAQCHDHKYDPISQEDYYRFYAFFNASSDGGMQTRKGNAAPLLEIADPANEAKLPSVKKAREATEKAIAELEQSSNDQLISWIDEVTKDSQTIRPNLDGCFFRAAFIEGEGDTATASLPSEVSGKINGKTQWTPSRVDWGLKFDGQTFVDFGKIADFERTDAFSYGGWIKPRKGSGQGAVLAKMDNSNGFRGYDILTGAAPVSVHLIHNWPGNAIKVTTKKKLVADKWQHVMMTYDGSSKASGIHIYVDGKDWEWKIEQDGLSETIRTEKTLLVGSRHPDSRFKGEIDEVQAYSRALTAEETKILSEITPIGDLLEIPFEKRSEPQQLAIRRYYLRNEHEEYSSLEEQLQSLTSQISELSKPMTSVMVMGDMESPRETFILSRGAYDSPTDQKVEAGTPNALPSISNELPINRLGLAKWLFQDDHPLTARVAINRYWQMLFGEGLVSTPQDFGAQGQFPSHPMLLDWLATDFRESGWDTKRILKEMLMSKTYQQTSACDPEAYQSDPGNRLLARGSRFRLPGESIRDAALQVSGLLVDQYGGPGVKPYQPPGLWAEVGLGGNPKFVQDHGDKLYRRSLYTYWKRSAPPPAMQIFDAPTREKCTVKRARTNTPLQALVTLNDTQFVEAARNFAERILENESKDDSNRLRNGFRRVTARFPKEQELNVLLDLLGKARQTYQADQDAAAALLAVGESKRNEAFQADEHAAWTLVASTILNLDEALTRE